MERHDVGDEIPQVMFEIRRQMTLRDQLIEFGFHRKDGLMLYQGPIFFPVRNDRGKHAENRKRFQQDVEVHRVSLMLSSKVTSMLRMRYCIGSPFRITSRGS